jgi:hypothetical protein
MLERPELRWLFGFIVAACIVALLAWARNDPGVGGRESDPPQSTTVVTNGDTTPPLDTTGGTDRDTVSPLNTTVGTDRETVPPAT